jgi:glucose-6-phosphate 1-dehydrogenase
LPALIDLYIARGLPDTFTIIASSRRPFSDTDYRAFVRDVLKVTDARTQKDIDDFCEHIQYVAGNIDEQATYHMVADALKAFDVKIGRSASRMLYLAVSPDFYSQIFDLLHESKAMTVSDTDGAWSRLLIEKPFGRDLESAKALDQKLRSLFSESQIYCIDHYLEKESIERILSVRFDNPVFRDTWNKEHIESMHIRMLESADVSARGGFYDNVGTVRDVVQNHLLQIVALLAMDHSHHMDAEKIHELRAEALSSFSYTASDTITRGQYKGFTETPGVDPHSQTETYFKIETKPGHGAWKDVSFILESGKALEKSIADAVIVFRADHNGSKNMLRFGFSPKPYVTHTVQEHDTDLLDSDRAGMPDGYERVLFDCMSGDQTRFVSRGEILASWEFITPILEALPALPLHIYEAGSSGPVVD